MHPVLPRLALPRLALPRLALPRRALPRRALPRRAPACALICALLTAALLAPARPAAAEPLRQEASFDLVMLGLTAGNLTFAGVEEEGSYAVTGTLASGGILAFIRKVRYDAEARGRVQDGRYIPRSYSEKADTGKRQSEAEMTYDDGVPRVMKYAPPRGKREWDVDPATQAGTVDILTALYATLQDVAPGQECNRETAMFDGRRASRLTLGAPTAGEDGSVTCPGAYRRVAGFSPEDMAERTEFPFTLTYAPGPDGRMRVVEVAMETLYGRARLVRQ